MIMKYKIEHSVELADLEKVINSYVNKNFELDHVIEKANRKYLLIFKKVLIHY